MTGRAMKLLDRIGKKDDASVLLAPVNRTAANELRKLELVVFIPISTGGAHVALTAKGVAVYHERETE